MNETIIVGLCLHAWLNCVLIFLISKQRENNKLLDTFIKVASMHWQAQCVRMEQVVAGQSSIKERIATGVATLSDSKLYPK
jgi:hypothetical protein